jgi:hypothetical protein
LTTRRASEHFTWTRHPEADPKWTQASALALGTADIEQLATMIARHAVEHRLARSPDPLAWWWRVQEGGTAYTESEAQTLRAYLGPLRPAGNADHLQGAVAEVLWHVLNVEDDEALPLVHVVGPKFHPTAPGYDGLTVRRDGALVVTLWEIKKHVGTQLSNVLAGAYEQLSANAARYLAEVAATAQLAQDPDVASACARLPEAWLAGEPHMRAGVAVTSQQERRTCFRTMKANFGHLTAPDPCVGLLAVLSDIPSFARKVGEVAWTGL